MNLDEFREHYHLRESARPVNPYESTKLGPESGLRTLGNAPISDVVFGRPPKPTSYLGNNTYLWVIDLRGIPYLIENPLKILDDRLPKHTNLTGGGPAYVGGELWFMDTSALYVSGGSGRFPPTNERQLAPQSQCSSLSAMPLCRLDGTQKPDTHGESCRSNR